jgi:hypothetical protein
MCSLGDRMRHRSKGCWSAGNAKVPVIPVRRPAIRYAGAASLSGPQGAAQIRSSWCVAGLPRRLGSRRCHDERSPSCFGFWIAVMGLLDLNGYPELGGVGQWAGNCHRLAGKHRPERSAVPVSAALLNPRSFGHARSVADLAVTDLPLRGATPAPGRSALGFVSRPPGLPR